MKVRWLDTFMDPPTATETANALVDEGADVINNHMSTAASVSAAVDNDVWAFTYTTSMSESGGEYYGGSALFDWGEYYKLTLQSVLDGSWTADEYWRGLDAGVVSAELGDPVPDDVAYSIPSCRRLLKEAGLRYQKPRRTAAEADETEQEAFRNEPKKKRQEMDATVVCIDQTKKSVQGEPRAAWFPRGTRPTVELSGQRDWTCLLGAITEDGDRFLSQFEEYVTADHAQHFI